jgi:hypothetical protein
MTQVRRLLAPLESWYVANADAGAMHNAAMTMHLAGLVLPTHQQLLAAAKRLVARVPVLLLGLHGRNPSSWAVAPASVLAAKLDQCVSVQSRSSDCTLLDVLRCVHQAQPPQITDDFLWHIFALLPSKSVFSSPQDYELVFLFHHALIDGR